MHTYTRAHVRGVKKISTFGINRVSAAVTVENLRSALITHLNMLEKPKEGYTYTLTRTSTKNRQINGANCFDLSEI